jgi:NAD(P)H-quinone oxidoreductase subunit 5
MTDSFAWLFVLGPTLLSAVGLVPAAIADRVAARMCWIARLASTAALGISLLGLGLIIACGRISTPPLGFNGVGVGVYLDAISAPMLCLVSFIGLVATAYSRNYLGGDPRQGRFVKYLSLTLGSVLFLILSGNLAQLTLAWIATSLSLNQLLLFYPERPAAKLAARKKFVVSRIGDACLIGAMLLLHQAFGSLDYVLLFEGFQHAGASGGALPAMRAAALLIALAALVKSAQFPLHGWLLEVMETPTPVSALLHAGIINAGGFVILRFAGLIALSSTSLDLLAMIGGLTALFGSLVMLTQTSVKVSLAYSTIAQMGFMMMECGLGAFSAAFLHILAHSLYKAHAFLSSGSVIDLARASWSIKHHAKPHPGRTVLVVTLVLAATIGIGTALGASFTEKPGIFALSAIVALGLIHLTAAAVDDRPSLGVIARVVGLASAAGAAYFALQLAAETLFAAALPPTVALRGPLDLAIVVLIIMSFAAVTILQSLLPGSVGAGPLSVLYVHAANGFYVNTVANRLILSLWPTTPRPSSPSLSAPVREGAR